MVLLTSGPFVGAEAVPFHPPEVGIAVELPPHEVTVVNVKVTLCGTVSVTHSFIQMVVGGGHVVLVAPQPLVVSVMGKHLDWLKLGAT